MARCKDVGRGGLGHLQGGETTLDVRVAVIQALIPLGLQAVEEPEGLRGIPAGGGESGAPV